MGSITCVLNETTTAGSFTLSSSEGEAIQGSITLMGTWAIGEANPAFMTPEAITAATIATSTVVVVHGGSGSSAGGSSSGPNSVLIGPGAQLQIRNVVIRGTALAPLFSGTGGPPLWLMPGFELMQVKDWGFAVQLLL